MSKPFTKIEITQCFDISVGDPKTETYSYETDNAGLAASEMVEAMAGLMMSMTYAPSCVIKAMKEYAQEHDHSFWTESKEGNNI